MRPTALNVLVAGFMTIDRIELPVRTITSVGGPPSYAGILCSRFGLDAVAVTKIGNDFPDEQLIWLARNGLHLRAVDKSSSKKTTRFRIVVNSESRDLYLVERCDDIVVEQIPETQFNASLVSPIAHEIPNAVFDEIRKRSDFCFLDPQGYVRSFDSVGKTSVKPWSDDKILGEVDALKMDQEEAQALTGKSEARAALAKLAQKGIRKAIVTQGADSVFVLDGFRISVIGVPKTRVVDTTGAGDILSGSLIACYLRSRDFLWSCCFGIASSALSLTSIALEKVDLPRSVDQQARRLYSSATLIETIS